MNRLAECDSCWKLEPVNDDSLCYLCEKEAEAFNHAAQQARLDGKSREAAYKAGVDAQEALDPTKDMSPLGAALFNCFRPSDPAKQMENLIALRNSL